MTNSQLFTDSSEESGASTRSAATPVPPRHRRREFLARVGGLPALAMGGSLLGARNAGAAPSAPQAATAGAMAPATSSPHRMALPLFRGKPHMLDNLTKDVFESHLNTAFRAHGLESQDENAAAPVKLELVRVEAGRGHDPQNGYESFSLLFRGPADAPLQQNSYELRHGALGQPTIFIVPVASDADGIYYEAVFNRLQRA